MPSPCDERTTDYRQLKLSSRRTEAYPGIQKQPSKEDCLCMAPPTQLNQQPVFGVPS